MWAVTTDTTNKESRPEIRVSLWKEGFDYRIFSRPVDLVDTTNKEVLLQSMMMCFRRDLSEIEPIRILAKISSNPRGILDSENTDKREDSKLVKVREE